MSIVITRIPRGMLGLNPDTPFDIKIVSGRRAGQRLNGFGSGFGSLTGKSNIQRVQTVLRDHYLQGASWMAIDGGMGPVTYNGITWVLGPEKHQMSATAIVAAIEAKPTPALAFYPPQERVREIQAFLGRTVDGKLGPRDKVALDAALPDWKSRPWYDNQQGNVLSALRGGGSANPVQPTQPVVNPTDVTNLTDLNLIRESAVARKATAMAYDTKGMSPARQSAKNNAVSQYEWAIQAIDAELKQGSHPAARYQKVVTDSRKKITYGDQAMAVAKAAPKPKPDPTTTCPAGQHRVMGVCVADAAPVPEPCPAGTHRVMGVCVANAQKKKDVVVPPPDPQCTAPNVWRDGVCTAPDEPEKPGMPWWGWAALAAGVIGVVAGGAKALSGNPLRGVSGHWEDAP